MIVRPRGCLEKYLINPLFFWGLRQIPLQLRLEWSYLFFHSLLPSYTLFLSISFAAKKMGLRCRVVRSVAHRSEVGSTGERDVIYLSGLEFMGTLQPLGSVGATTR